MANNYQAKSYFTNLQKLFLKYFTVRILIPGIQELFMLDLWKY